MATYKYDAATGAYVLIDESALLSITTDLPDYAPGSTAYFTANVTEGDTVTFNVIDVAGTPVSGTNTPWTITDGGEGDLDGHANGVIQTSWAVGADAANEAFVLSATDQASGLMATAAFTDAAPASEPTVFGYIDAHIELAASSGTTTTAAGAIWANAGTALTAQTTSSGTGLYSTFSELQ